MQTLHAAAAAATAALRRHVGRPPCACAAQPRRGLSASMLAAGALLLGAQAAAQAQPDAGQPARTDVQAACPAIAELLQRELALPFLLQGKPGTVQVRFAWQDGAVHGVTAQGGPAEYRQPIRRALQGATCRHGRDGDRFAFAVRFDAEAGAGAAPGLPRQLALGHAP